MPLPRSLGPACIAMLVACNGLLGIDDRPAQPQISANLGGASSSGQSGAGGSTGTGTGTSGGSGGSGGAECLASACPGLDGECSRRACIDGQCGFIVEPPRTACDASANGLCDGMGECVQCLDDDDCPAVCVDGSCYHASCGDQQKNGSESDVDCGGDCPPCANGLVCAQPSDCASTLCIGLACTPCGLGAPLCAVDLYCDGDVGHCLPLKGAFQVCANDYECQSGICNLICAL